MSSTLQAFFAPALSTPSGRPIDGEFASYAKSDIDWVPGTDAVAALTEQGARTLELLEPLTAAQVAGLTYAAGKWTLKEVVGHLADDERIFTYRALCVARNDPRPLPGFDEKTYVAFASFEQMPWRDLLADYRAVRQASITFFSGLTAEAWVRRGIVNEYEASVRGLAFHIVGHELRHIRAIREKYLVGNR
jgi:hypothetical protein